MAVSASLQGAFPGAILGFSQSTFLYLRLRLFLQKFRAVPLLAKQKLFARESPTKLPFFRYSLCFLSTFFLKLKNLILPDDVKKLYDELNYKVKAKENAIKVQDYENAAKYRDEELELKSIIEEKNRNSTFNTDIE